MERSPPSLPRFLSSLSSLPSLISLLSPPSLSLSLVVEVDEGSDELAHGPGETDRIDYGNGRPEAAQNAHEKLQALLKDVLEGANLYQQAKFSFTLVSDRDAVRETKKRRMVLEWGASQNRSLVLGSNMDQTHEEQHEQDMYICATMATIHGTRKETSLFSLATSHKTSL